MRKTSKKKLSEKVRMVHDETMKDYTNDPYFGKKREAAQAFLNKAGLPPSFSKPKTKL